MKKPNLKLIEKALPKCPRCGAPKNKWTVWCKLIIYG